MKRPIGVTIIAVLYLVIGVVGFVAHFRDALASPSDGVMIETTEAIAAVCGAFLLRGQNWARWLAVAWIGFHVVLSAFHSARECAIHAVFCAVIAWLLFSSASAPYFRRPRGQTA